MFLLHVYCDDSVMNDDLEPFEKLGGITKKQFDNSRSRGTHYQIINHRLYREEDCMFPFRFVINRFSFLLPDHRWCDPVLPISKEVCISFQ